MGAACIEHESDRDSGTRKHRYQGSSAEYSHFDRIQSSHNIIS